MKDYYAIGLMSGSSLDGLDIVYCRISWLDNVVDWELIHAETIAFSDKWSARLSALPEQSALIYAKTHTYLGHYFASLTNAFIERNNITNIDFIASHGHTVFHDPERRLTSQIGDGAAIAAITKQRVITDFRTQDVALNGEGAPLAPLADMFLFKGYDYYLNMGGIANLSTQFDGKWLGFDVCPLNQVLNHFASEKGLAFDTNGAIAANGDVHKELMEALMSMPYFAQNAPKSLGNGWIRKEVLPLYRRFELSPEDALATAVEHAALEIAEATAKYGKHEKREHTMLVTGGGAFNTYLMERVGGYINQQLDCRLIVPDAQIVSFKEAILMALLGVLRLECKANSLPSITNALRPTINGAVFEGRIF